VVLPNWPPALPVPAPEDRPLRPNHQYQKRATGKASSCPFQASQYNFMNRMLTTAMEYRPALLWLLGQIGEARTADVLIEFDRRLGHLIPPRHRERIRSGNTRWENFVHWARLLLVQAGFVTSGERGIWGITAAGRAWLQRYPDGGDWRDLTALTRKTATSSWGRAAGAELKAVPPASSTEPQALRTAIDYRPALLWLMGEIGVSRASVAIKAFERTLGHLIPPEHRRSSKSGRSRWEEYLHWARQDLVNAELMGSEKRGLWAITADGRTWLGAHPDGGGRQLLERLRGNRSARHESAAPTPTIPAQPAKRQTLRLRGRTFTFSGPEVLDAVRTAMAEGVPREATRFKNWFLLADGQRVSVKWVVGLITGLPLGEFQASEARRVLRTLGLEIGDAGNAPAEATEPGAMSFPESLDYSAFFGVVQDHLKGRLPAGLSSQAVRQHGNLVQIGGPISRSHYELRLARAYTEIALHLEGSQEQNLRVLNRLHAHMESLQTQLGEPVLAEPWGRDRARMYLMRAPGRMDAATATVLADSWLRFILATLPILQAIALDLSIAVRRGRHSDEARQEDLTRQRAILADEIRAIRGFLAASHSAAPSDEKLCDWVQFCYLFELFAEAVSLFKMIRPEQVDPWLYERVVRLARACELHLNPRR
jgi:restriction endonuclease Mrr